MPPPVVLHTRVVTGTGGGPDKTILNSPRFLAQHGYRALCAYMHPPDDPGFEELQRRGAALEAPVLSVPDRGPWDLGVARRMLEICRRERVTIWHGHDYKSNLIGLLLQPYWPMRLVTTVHGWVKFTSRTPLYYWIDRLCLPRYERVVCVSDDLLERCLQFGVPEGRAVLIENAIDTQQYARRQTPAEAKQSLGFAPDRLLVGAVGRLSAEKGFDLLIRAVARLIEEGQKVDLAIVGEGDARPELESLIAAQKDPGRFRLLGYRSDTIDLYHAMDVFVLSSLREGLPNVVLEAMALEVPVVATRVAGVPRVIEHEQNGLVVEIGALEELTDAIRRLLQQPDLRSTLAGAARGTIEARYSFAVRMEKIRRIYEQVLERRSDA